MLLRAHSLCGFGSLICCSSFFLCSVVCYFPQTWTPIPWEFIYCCLPECMSKSGFFFYSGFTSSVNLTILPCGRAMHALPGGWKWWRWWEWVVVGQWDSGTGFLLLSLHAHILSLLSHPSPSLTSFLFPSFSFFLIFFPFTFAFFTHALHPLAP